MFGLGLPELLIIALLILFFFGAKRLPGIGTGLGKTVKEIRNIKKELSKDKESAKKTDAAEDPASEDKSFEGKVTESLQEKLTDKVIAQVPGIKQAKSIKDKADKIKKIVS
ncbi:MAG: twin-arginine translocase TatA/TatE family subunit [Deltaproteobacteria bacterium]|nr:twin-arginine translocase TatA/TatE family subunit [Deltaproteobacteria bacterium]MBW2019902.1 twin-arginine translocase TatA/TatE family subunit [Deltaproteobacteria bacterium]MBW2074958.1 twin-arginine translocase TatA/TatE family subunit [Deltaproteobacteria bacterium]RLB82419.1 MAG: twin-arginine translocase TatA/TatE family subunit [Deltaproteobacteria bacterium]